MKTTVRFRKTVYLLVVAVLFAGLSVIKAGENEKKVGEKIILIYKTTLNTDVHQRDSDSGYWSYYIDTNRYYNIVEFDPQTRSYGKEYIIHYYGKKEKVQSLKKGLQYKELKKSEKETQRYVKASSFAKDSNLNGDVVIKYGVVNLAAPIDVGWDKKVAVALKLSDKIIYRGKSNWKNFSDRSASCVFHKRYTKEVNEEQLDIAGAVKFISKKLYDRGYKPLLTIDDVEE